MGKKSSPSNLSQGPKFFKIVVDPQDHKLRIPKAFIRKYGRNLSDRVTLQAPNGSVRQVELVKLDGETWIYNGWDKFKDDYAMSIGHLLVFEYDGKSHFDVFIFDMTALEIEYPIDIASEDDQVTETEVNESESVDSSVILKQDVRTTVKRKRISNYGRRIGAKGQLSKKKMTRITDKERCVAYRRAKAFKSKNPFCIFLMQPTYVTSAFACIPVAFARKHLPEQRNQIRLCVQKKRTWTVTCTVMPSEAKLILGWWKFVRANDLKVGDACVFEVNRRKKLLWNVTIFRG